MNRPRLEDFLASARDADRGEEDGPGEAFLAQALSAAYAAQPHAAAHPAAHPAAPSAPTRRPQPKPAFWGFGLGLAASLFAGFWVGYGDPLGLAGTVLPDVSGQIATLDALVDFTLPALES